MRSSNTSTEICSTIRPERANLTIDADVLAIHVMRALSRAQQRGESLSLEALASLLQVRKVDVRRVVSALDKRGFVDAMRMRVTMMGFVLGCSVTGSELKSARKPAKRAAVSFLRAA
jgi:hypothetical protein